MRTPEEIQSRLAAIASEYETANLSERRYLNHERYILQWVMRMNSTKPNHVASKIVKNAMA